MLQFSETCLGSVKATNFYAAQDANKIIYFDDFRNPLFICESVVEMNVENNLVFLCVLICIYTEFIQIVIFPNRATLKMCNYQPTFESICSRLRLYV
jgi:hypothetical protein